MSAPVVVSAGEPVAWRVADGAGKTVTIAESAVAAKAFTDRPRGYTSTELFASAPVVLPEEPPAELIEAIGKAMGEVGGVQLPCDHVAVYDAVRSWVAGGGETR